MSTYPAASSHPDGPVRKKRLLLVDSTSTKRDLRADVMRKCGIDVDTAADIVEARSLWQEGSYDLVLMNVSNDFGSRDEFCKEIRNIKRPQRIAFLVGSPEYLSAVPDADSNRTPGGTQQPWRESVSALLMGACEKLPQRWGIQEACWRIRAARAAMNPRIPTPASSRPAKPSRWTEAMQQFEKLQGAAKPESLPQADLGLDLGSLDLGNDELS